ARPRRRGLSRLQAAPCRPGRLRAGRQPAAKVTNRTDDARARQETPAGLKKGRSRTARRLSFADRRHSGGPLQFPGSSDTSAPQTVPVTGRAIFPRLPERLRPLRQLDVHALQDRLEDRDRSVRIGRAIWRRLRPPPGLPPFRRLPPSDKSPAALANHRMRPTMTTSTSAIG